MKPTPALPEDRWLVPGSASLAMFMPDLHVRHEHGEITEAELRHLIERRLLAIVIGAMHDLGVRNIALIEDLAQELRLRLATMKAVERFDPAQSLPTTYLVGVARMLIREQLWRRERPETIADDLLEFVATGESQLDRAVRLEGYQELYRWLDQLSDGEFRAVIRVFGPIRDYSPPKTRRRLRNPEALDRAVEILRVLGAHHFDQ